MTLKLGERRNVGIEIFEKDAPQGGGTPFTVENASYVLSRIEQTEGCSCKSTEEIERGSCAVNGHILTAVFEAREKGKYELSFRYEIANEVFVYDVNIHVVQ